MKRSQNDSPIEHYHNSGLTLLALGAVMMLMSLFYMCNESPKSEHDHVSNFLLGLVVGLTGWWLRSHTEEDLED